jgi:hypothetical protein
MPSLVISILELIFYNILLEVLWKYSVPVMEVHVVEDPVMEVPNMGTNNICKIFSKSQIFPLFFFY